MKVAILGGTGKLGLGLAQRLHRSGHAVMIGSRDASKAAEAARTLGGQIEGATNQSAAAWCETAFISVPYGGHRSLTDSVKEGLSGKIIIDATVPIDPANILQIKTESGRSAAEETAATIPTADVFAAFQTVSHRVLRAFDVSHDVLVAGGSNRKPDVLSLIQGMNLRPVDAGPIEIAGHLERMTVLLLSINKANKVKESGIKITGI
jgi:NADPH-dependent F420 reductase